MHFLAAADTYGRLLKRWRVSYTAKAAPVTNKLIRSDEVGLTWPRRLLASPDCITAGIEANVACLPWLRHLRMEKGHANNHHVPRR